ncbi:ABC transporter substrate-binding protein [Phytoactinopolyspora halotolerans]|uniref:Sugar ABC transporter substrate-binding protein n=1 Tax=Phytoactinopolyspora halotolerans TaxID=1981512 RepID=A0A6L9S9E0_9ACTN|nr:sugar ABC transporter substrate-binding protein [Phytoactinopolyspora halotolerans]NEE01709.1 sugar ABC transporter substrate-binding protein [Phytoactinopolyspora halotolerans]
MRHRTTGLAAASTCAVLLVAACGDGGGSDGNNGGDTDAAGVTIEYWLWDSNQRPQYEQCAEAFTAETGIEIEFSVFAWEEYWSNLNTQFTAGRAPDVFTDHLAFYPTFVQDQVLLPLDEYIAADDVDMDKYLPGLADLWVGQDGSTYGLPKDWDTIAMAYNSAMVDDAGLSADDINTATWNPDDGGTFEDIIARLSVDENGVRGDEPGFDPNNVAVYGLSFENPSNSASGQTSWGNFARSLGFELLADGNPWGTDYQFDDPRLADTLDWFARMIEAGYITPLGDLQGVGFTELFNAGDVAMVTNGSWAISGLVGNESIDVEFAPLPEGPEGRWSMYNGLADSITADSEHPDEAWQWVNYLGSAECQDVVGEHAVVFPAVESSLEIGEQAREDAGIDVSAFLTYIENDSTFLYPVTTNFDQVTQAVGAAIDEILLGQRDAAEALTGAQTQVDQIMGR